MYKIDWNKYLSPKRLRESGADRARQENENIDKRQPFESDFGRVAFSSASRRMHDKTQVFPLAKEDHIHTRLTHSVEVMNMGYSLGVSISRNPQFVETYGKEEANEIGWRICSILKTACFVHDIGNPPFGHYGEDVMKNYFERMFNNINYSGDRISLGNGTELRGVSEEQIREFQGAMSSNEKFDFTQFDGNAEGFRILTKLQYLDDLYGLNLTCATLATYLKYPNIGSKSKEKGIAQKKHGIFYSEKDYLEKIAQECGLKKDDNSYKRHPLSFLVEAADSLCYLSMDIEDGLSKGFFDYHFLKEKLSTNAKLKEILDNIKEKTADGKTIPIKKVQVNFRNAIISYFTDLAINNFINHLEEIDRGEYDEELIKDDENSVEKTLSAFSVKYIYSNKDIEYLELTGQSVINGLLDIYMRLLFNEDKGCRERARAILPKSIVSAAILEAPECGSLYETEKIEDKNITTIPIAHRLRIIRDNIAGMTDNFALDQYRKLSGQQI